jgi:hypothetical protein
MALANHPFPKRPRSAAVWYRQDAPSEPAQPWFRCVYCLRFGSSRCALSVGLTRGRTRAGRATGDPARQRPHREVETPSGGMETVSSQRNGESESGELKLNGSTTAEMIVTVATRSAASAGGQLRNPAAGRRLGHDHHGRDGRAGARGVARHRSTQPFKRRSHRTFSGPATRGYPISQAMKVACTSA